MAAGGHFWWPKITFNRIYRHFRSMNNFFTKWPPAAILDDRKSLLIIFLAILDQYATFNFFELFSQNGPPATILDDRKSLLDRISCHFRSIRSFSFFLKFLQNGRRRLFWMGENHFRLIRSIHYFFFWFFFQNGRRRPFWITIFSKIDRDLFFQVANI